MALLNINNLKTLAAIGEIGKRKKFNCLATGFFVGFIAKNSKDQTKKTYYLFLVTNRHVFKDKINIYLRLNKKDGKAKIFKQNLSFDNNEPRWLEHRNKNVDLALLNISPKKLEENDIDFTFFKEEMFSYYKNFKKIGIEVGDETYILGFPLGISGIIQNYACAKWGIISRIDKELIYKKKAFLLDSSIFPGNSGSPVILKPTLESLNGTQAVLNEYLLGVVSGYIPYEEGLYTHQTNPPSLVSLSRENSGLSLVVPIDFIRQIYRRWISKRKKLEKAQKQAQQSPEKIQSDLPKSVK